ncbi:hypothetical protein [Carboxylicivirga marina]|uniref:Uncharacterized protein n=1 Tax=Carboxylicivirga marina TaxID=2800988 RepID=A0ABS1HL52_9BACT|nr:hypothetical protein [Carboxylicivirga marina]MBK3518393.1 hypothetical protein [Carboxylicivirga marina]
MKTLVKAKKQEQFKKFKAKDTAFLKKVVGGDGSNNDMDETSKTKL